MKKPLLLLALIVWVSGVGYWAALGAHRGWSQNRVPSQKTDDITGITYTVYEDRFVPGIEIPGGATLLAALLAGTSLFLRSKPSNQHE